MELGLGNGWARKVLHHLSISPVKQTVWFGQQSGRLHFALKGGWTHYFGQVFLISLIFSSKIMEKEHSPHNPPPPPHNPSHLKWQCHHENSRGKKEHNVQILHWIFGILVIKLNFYFSCIPNIVSPFQETLIVTNVKMCP